MPSVNQDSELDPHFWRSLGQVANSDEFRAYLEGQDPGDATDELSGVSRRRFMQLMGASITLAGLASCRWESDEILAENQRPEGTLPGEPRHYATAFEHAGVSQPLLVTSIDGRPIKIEGHPDHPAAQGAASLFAQASILALCDPDRSKRVQRAGAKPEDPKPTWSDVFEALRPVIASQRAAQGRGIAVVAPASAAPTWQRLKARFLAEFPQAIWAEHESAARENERLGAELAFGQSVRTRFQLRNAARLLLLESDLLSQHPDGLRVVRDFAARRTPGDQMSRVYAVESTLSQTGAKADHRVPLAPTKAFDFLTRVRQALRALESGAAPSVAGIDAGLANTIVELAKDLHAHRGSSLIVVGPTLPPEVHALAHRVNAELGAVGRTLTYGAEPLAGSVSAGLARVEKALQAGQVEFLLHLGTNPAYDAPADIRYGDAIGKARTSVHAGLYRDETGARCGWHLPMSHYLEAWADGRTFDGEVTIAQPLIAPIYDSHSAIEILAKLFVDDEARGQDLVRDTHGLDERAWRKAVHDGFIAGTAAAGLTPTLAAQEPSAPAGAKSLADGRAAFDLVFRPSEAVYDGRYANNGWLQEVPDFITKLTWDNALLMAVEDCEQIGVDMGDWVEVRHGSLAQKLPVYPLHGQARGTLSLALGYGREEGGVVAGSLASSVTSVGFHASRLRTAAAPWIASGVSVAKVGGTYDLAMTQEHHLIDEIGRKGQEDRVPNLIRAADLEKWQKKKDFARYTLSPKENAPLPLTSQWEEHRYEGMKWGMAIDLNKCVGCNACIVACQSENNIPVVGKDQVRRGREMHWLRVDRYLIGKDLENPRVDPQPLPCMQCELAPCEQVCPVTATVHNEEGLNDMVYNRCVGTRYCANNCPYKVRRFNYLNYQLKMNDDGNESLKLAHNPEVTIRSRGVMEKCTYCTQRISAARSAARIEKRAIQDGDIVTACQQTCPADAISFGDLNLAGSRVAADHDDPRAYAMLGELNVKPRTLYLAVVRNPNPALS